MGRPPSPDGGPEPPLVVNVDDTYRVAQLCGPGSASRTDVRWNVYGTDLGHMFVHEGQLAMTFGDTFGGPAAYPFFSVAHGEWRSNTMALIDPSPTPPVDGLVFTSMITDPSGAAKELLSSRKDSSETTVIPTYGVSVGNRMFLHYMSVHQWGAPGLWTLNYSGMAHSDDGGTSWVKDPATTWAGDSNFGQVAMVTEEPYVYLLGIPGGRHGSLQLARVPTTGVLDISAYQYWSGVSWVRGEPQSAVDIVPAPVGELSVQWSSFHRQWLMAYLDDPASQVVLRMSGSLTGPWSAPQVVVDGSQFPQLYAPYLAPMWDDGPDVYFTMSVYDHYQVYLMHTSLGPR